MPKTPKRPCRYPGCPNLCDKGVYCSKHMEFSSDRMRGGAEARGYDARWRKARKHFLECHPLCAVCMRHGKLTPAVVVDHVIPHRGDKKLFWDEKNWQPLCKNCHDRKQEMECKNACDSLAECLLKIKKSRIIVAGGV